MKYAGTTFLIDPMLAFVQSDEDADSIRKDGFSDVRVPGTHVDFRGKRLGHLSGAVFERPGYRTIYVAGDTAWSRYRF